jgi:hypothetical protein
MCQPFPHTCGDAHIKASFSLSSLALPYIDLLHFRASIVFLFSHSPISLSSLTMPPFHVARISSAVWRWLRRCPDVIGPVNDTSSDEEFFTPPTSPLRHAEEPSVVPVFMSQPLREQALSPAQSARLRRRHVEVVRQLTTPTPVVAPSPPGPLKPYQIPIKVYRPSWAP